MSMHVDNQAAMYSSFAGWIIDYIIIYCFESLHYSIWFSFAMHNLMHDYEVLFTFLCNFLFQITILPKWTGTIFLTELKCQNSLQQTLHVMRS